MKLKMFNLRKTLQKRKEDPILLTGGNYEHFRTLENEKKYTLNLLNGAKYKCTTKKNDLTEKNLRRSLVELKNPKRLLKNLSKDKKGEEKKVKNQLKVKRAKSLSKKKSLLIKMLKLNDEVNIKNFYNYTKKCLKLINCIEDNKIELKSTSQKKVTIKNPNKRKFLAVFDLDETLIHSITVGTEKKGEDILEVKYKGKIIEKIKINVRPHLKEAIEKISENYAIAIYTSSNKEYADTVLNYLDKDNKYFYNRFYETNCQYVVYNDYHIMIKDLSIFQDFDINKILIIDNSVISFGFYINNGIPILSYYNSKNDNELITCAEYLTNLSKYDDIVEYNKKFININKYREEIRKDDNFVFSFEKSI